MKLLIASDLHGNGPNVLKLQERIEAEQPDFLVLLGDLLYHGPRNPLPEGYDTTVVTEVLNNLKLPILAVKGNCDSEVDQMVLNFPCQSYTAELHDGAVTLFFTHGHRDNLQPENHIKLAPGTIFASGHTHIKRLEKEGGVVYLNPGSVGIPKDGSASYALYNDGVISLHDLEGNQLGETLSLK